MRMAGRSNRELGAQHQRVAELAAAAHGLSRYGAVVTGNKIHQAEAQGLHARLAGNLKSVVNRQRRLDQHVQRQSRRRRRGSRRRRGAAPPAPAAQRSRAARQTAAPAAPPKKMIQAREIFVDKVPYLAIPKLERGQTVPLVYDVYARGDLKRTRKVGVTLANSDGNPSSEVEFL